MQTRTMKMAGRVVVAMVVAAMGRAWAALPEVVGQIPGDATMAVVVGNLKATSTKVSNLATRLDVAKKTGVPVPADLVGFGSRMLGITKGVDANGSAALVMLKLPEGGPGQGPPPMVLLIPTTDAAGMLEGFSPGAADAQGIQEVTLPQNEQKGYAATVAGKWVACAIDKEVLGTYLKRSGGLDKGLAGPVAKAFETNDAVVWLNMEGLRPMVEQGLGSAAQVMQMQMQAAGNRDAFSGALQRAVATLYLEGITAVVRDADHLLMTVRLSDGGIATGFGASMKEGSAMAKLLAGQKATSAPTLAGLPGGEFLLATSMRVNGEALQGTVQEVVDRVLANPDIKDDPKAAALRQTAELVKQSIGMIRGWSMVAQDAGDGTKGFFKGAMLIDVTDPAKYLQLMAQQYGNAEAMQAMGSMSPDIQVKSTYTPDAATVQGVKFAKVQVQYTLREETAEKPLAPGAREGFQMIQAIYGPEGTTTYMGAVGGQVLAVIGADEAMVGTAVTAAQAKKDELGALPGIVGAKGQLAANPVMVGYLSVGKCASLFTKLTGQGGGSWVGVLEKAPPVVMSAGITENLLTEEMFVPVGVVGAVMDAGTARRPGGEGGMP